MNNCWALRGVIQDGIIKEVLKFLEKKDSMLIDKDPLPHVAFISMVNVDL